MSHIRPYGQDARDHVLRLIEGGLTITKACSILNVPLGTVIGWVRRDEDYAKRYAHAREMQAHTIADEMVEIADAPILTMEAVQHAKLRIETRKWLLSRWAPKQYGERAHVHGNQQIGVVLLPPLNLDQKSIKSIAEHSPGSDE